MHSTTILSYIDPGTGSMLFTLVIGLLSAGYFFFRNFAIRLKFLVTGGNAKASDETMPYVIFSDDKRYWNVFEPICDEFERRGIDVVYWTASPDDEALGKAYEHVTCEFIGEGNKAFAKLNMMSADICLATTPGLEVYQWKRSKNVKWYVHTLHALSTAAWYRMFGLDFYDAVLLCGEFQEREIRELEEKRGLAPKELAYVGCTYMDVMRERLRSDGEESHEGTTVLLAPSWGPISLLNRYGERMLDALVETGFDLVVRPHPQSMKSEKELLDRLMARYPESEHLSWNFDRDNYEVLRRSDVMISDMSGVIQDFAFAFDKPVIYSLGGIDTAAYDAAWLDQPFWELPIFTSTGIPIDESQFDDMRAVIERVLSDPDIKGRRERARDEAWLYQGESAVRTVDYLVQKREELLAGAES